MAANVPAAPERVKAWRGAWFGSVTGSQSAVGSRRSAVAKARALSTADRSERTADSPNCRLPRDITPPYDATEAPPTRSLDFIREIVEEDLRTGKHATVVTRFPPEPNGYLHIGHAKSICLNFGVAARVRRALQSPLRRHESGEGRGGVRARPSSTTCTGSASTWGGEPLHASDYFDQLYEWAELLIARREGVRRQPVAPRRCGEYRGTLTEPGKESPYRNRSVDENLDLFRRMRAGEFPDGAHVLRAKIDMASPNINMRDPVLYRIRHEDHHRTGDKWCIYPMYDYAHPLVGRDRGDHALALHAGVRGPPPAVRLAGRDAAGAVAAAADTSSRG